METGSVVVHKGGKEKKYDIYIEDYVLSYLKREMDSLELSEIFFYGFQQEAGRKLFVYGAGRGRSIPAFSGYDLLEALMCRLTQAGPVFMMREGNDIYEIKGYKVFYMSNEAMQRYLLEWREESGTQSETTDEPSELQQTTLLPPFGDHSRKVPHGAMSLQLCLILMVLVAIVISSANSYDKMGQLNRSAREVFFAIENQEAEEGAEDSDQENQRETEIVVQRDTMAVKKEETLNEEDALPEAEQKTDEGSVLESSEDKPIKNESEEKEEKEEVEVEESVPTVTESSDEDNTEALSRSVTRYYEVEQGDTLYTISQKIYGDTSRVERICEINEIEDPDRIRSGQKIILP
ncbi:MAG: LysM peptidoglycan-binding domain-containing protein [Lachnospiraceae bacterium]|nr:LysM peptidoglycan-binding domain-containing protein [Lachnospiraceae bacterium]